MKFNKESLLKTIIVMDHCQLISILPPPFSLMENGQDSDYFTFAPKNTFANIVFEKLTNRTKTCYVRDGRNFFVFGKHFNKFFVLASEFIIKVSKQFLFQFASLSSDWIRG